MGLGSSQLAYMHELPGSFAIGALRGFTSTDSHGAQLKVDCIDVYNGVIDVPHVIIAQHALGALRDDVILALQHAHVEARPSGVPRVLAPSKKLSPPANLCCLRQAPWQALHEHEGSELWQLMTKTRAGCQVVLIGDYGLWLAPRLRVSGCSYLQRHPFQE